MNQTRKAKQRAKLPRIRPQPGAKLQMPSSPPAFGTLVVMLVVIAIIGGFVFVSAVF